MNITESFFLLGYIKYGDFDGILHLFGKERGYKSFFLKGLYRKGNKSRAYIMPLAKILVTFPSVEKEGRLLTISQIESGGSSFDEISMKENTVRFFVSDFLNHLLRNHQEGGEIFDELEEFSVGLKDGNYASHLILLIRLLKYDGHSPLLSDGDYLDPETGEFTHEPASSLFSKSTSLFWKTVLGLESPYQHKFSNLDKSSILDSILSYYRTHQGNFRVPKSLEIVRQLF